MPDVSITLGTAGARAGAATQVAAGAPLTTNPPFSENLSSFEVGDYVVVDGWPARDSGVGARIDSELGYDSHTVVTSPLARATLYPDAYAHWIAGTAYASLDGALYRWWPVGSARTNESARMSFFRGQEGGSGGLQYGDGKGAPYHDNDYTYQGYGRAMSQPAVVFPGTGYAKIDPEANFASATLEVTAILHPSNSAYYGIFEAAQYVDDTSNVSIGDPMVLRWHHGQLRLYHEERQVLAHESHRASAAPVTMLVSLDAATDIGRFYALDENRTTRTFNTEGLDTVALLGIFGGLGQGRVENKYRLFAEMDVLDVAIWDYAMDWPEMQSKANLAALAYGVGL